MQANGLQHRRATKIAICHLWRFFVFLSFLTSKQGTEAKSCLHLHTQHAQTPNARRHTGISPTKRTQMQTDMQTTTHIRSEPV